MGRPPRHGDRQVHAKSKHRERHVPARQLPLPKADPLLRRRPPMGKTLGLALAMTLGLSLTAMAAETRGTIYSMDTSNHTIVLEDGTRLWVTEGPEATVSPGSYADAAYETKRDKKLVIERPHRVGLEGSSGQVPAAQGDGVPRRRAEQ